MGTREEGGAMVDEGGRVLAARAYRPQCEEAAEYAHGRVLELGLGYGFTRERLLASRRVASLRTVEGDPEVKAIFDSGREPAEGEQEVVVSDARAELRRAARAGESFDSMVMDLGDETAMLGDTKVLDDLRAVLPALGARLVILTSSHPGVIPGFKAGSVDSYEWGVTVIYSRWDPMSGLGEEVPVHIPGRGFARPWETEADDERAP